MAFIDEIPDAVTAEADSVWTWDDGTGDSWLVTKSSQANALYNIRDSQGQLTWTVVLQKDFFDALQDTDAGVTREGLKKLAARLVLWADQIDAR